MIKKHPQSRAERMLLNEKKKKDKGNNIKRLSHKSSGSLPSDLDEGREDI